MNEILGMNVKEMDLICNELKVLSDDINDLLGDIKAIIWYYIY